MSSGGRSNCRRALGRPIAAYTPGALSYDLRRLRLHGFITRLPKTHRYRVTADGLRTALFFVRLYTRAVRRALTSRGEARDSTPRTTAYQRLDAALDVWLTEAHLAA